MGDTNIPLTETSPEDRIEIMWKERFNIEEAAKEKEQINQIVSEFNQIRNKILMNDLEPIIREGLKDLQQFFQKYSGFLAIEKVSAFYHSFIEPRKNYLWFNAELRISEEEFKELRKELFEIDLRSNII